MTTYVLRSRDDHRLINQTGVRQYHYPLRHSHNAIWDSNAGPDGKHLVIGATERLGTVVLYQLPADERE